MVIEHFNYLQMVENEQFQMFDYGPEGNQRKYNQVSFLLLWSKRVFFLLRSFGILVSL